MHGFRWTCIKLSHKFSQNAILPTLYYVQCLKLHWIVQHVTFIGTSGHYKQASTSLVISHTTVNMCISHDNPMHTYAVNLTLSL